MTVTDVTKDSTALTMVVTAELQAPVARAWELWSDPRQLERWWGPPTWPATFVDHDLVPGGRMNYYMTGPDGEKAHAWWIVTNVDAPNSLEFDDGFAHDVGVPNEDMPVCNIRVDLDGGAGDITTMSIRTAFPSVEAMEQLIQMGMDEGMTLCVAQIDEILAAETATR